MSNDYCDRWVTKGRDFRAEMQVKICGAVPAGVIDPLSVVCMALKGVDGTFTSTITVTPLEEGADWESWIISGLFPAAETEKLTEGRTAIIEFVIRQPGLDERTGRSNSISVITSSVVCP